MEQSDATTVFGLEDEFTAADITAWSPLETRVFRPLVRSLGYAPGLTKALREADLDIVLLHGLWKFTSAAALQWHRRSGRPFIVHPHGMLDPWALRNSGWKKRVASLFYENATLRSAACIRALCESEAQSIRDYGLMNPICVIPNGIDLPNLGTPPNSEFRIPNSEGRNVLLYLGRLHPKKNLGPLLRAWATAQSEVSAARNWLLAIAGWDEGGYEATLRAAAAELQLSSVVFLGPLFGEDKAAALRRIDAFILPSLSEGLPMVVLEAWAYAKPVLMTAACNLPEGFRARAALQIGTAAEEMLPGLQQMTGMEPEQRTAMGRNGRDLVAQNFSWEKIGKEMRRVCQWVVHGGEAPASVRFESAPTVAGVIANA
jgi:poly(glycerol-phosphate) alpha-glucosyltransferase